MGLSQCIDTRHKDPPSISNPSKTSSAAATDQCCGYDEIKIKSLKRKMLWELGLACILPSRRSRKDQREGKKNKKNNATNSEHNKAWLLAESGAGDLPNGGDPQSVHSSFRFSLCSQVELESVSAGNSTPATVLMVNLENGFCESRSPEQKWRRIVSLERNISPVAHTLIRFSYSEIVSATGNFSRGRILGRGALSYVFRGRIGLLRTVVAVKRLDKEDKEAPKSFCRELMIASSLENSYIVPLVGYCIDPDEGLFLVYKYVSGGSLEQFLHEKKRGVKGASPLSWPVRYKVAIGIAEAVGYLHYGTDRCVVHRDIKPSNILLSSKKAPKLCDFGLAMWTPAPAVPFLCKTVKGTFGYLAPEYFQHGKVSDKTDVYAFGVVLLELITGRKPIDSKREPGEENLVLWAKPLLQQGSIERLLDPRIQFSPKHSKIIVRMMKAAAACLSTEELRRPNMDEVIDTLRRTESSFLCGEKPPFSGNGGVVDYYSHLQQAQDEISGHLALAML